ncbi:photosynthetic reaction center subunit H [Maritimibacter sp. UBA3975]|uniref:photosynthetic reaction center subunit H n=1 Tax=Maritimibacter sp. UBA3975 TaxID=1946833 RepID=UPI000C0934B6|nr:photosynthetic reaction center subunit H [Maritimibacter sp. UBA3975]MAM62912.1 photosynthetic reaction center subunit H [Maritimibacter sp.]|tara:strand:- start:10240 stop:11013 length:774 start_codon:yes stop_codon:yes gene_type:complete
MTGTFFANFDLASLSLWMFWVFFALLVYYLQRENMREGYPLEDDDGKRAPNSGLIGAPEDKTFLLPHGRGTYAVPSGQNPERANLALAKTAAGNGFPMAPTGDPMIDGVGPASWAERRDSPELDGSGHPKIVPMSAIDGVTVAAGRDPRGLPVVSGDDKVIGTITDMWIDEPEQMVRYLEYELAAEFGEGKRLVPMTLSSIKSDRVRVRTLFAHQFATVPQHASPRQVTLLEEDKISGYYAGGLLYASEARLEPQLG